MGTHNDIILLILQVPEELFKDYYDKDHIFIDFLRYI